MRLRFLFMLGALALGAATGSLGGCRSAPRAGASAPVPKAWQPKSQDAKHRLEGFRAYLRRSYPRLGLESKDQLWETALAYVQWLGLEVDSQPGTARLEDTLSSLVAAPNQAATRWLLQGTLQSRSRGGAPSESAFYGVAVLTRSQEELTLRVDSARGDFAFRGRVRQDRLRGHLIFVSGATRWSGKAQGTLAPGRISLQGQGRAGHQAVQGEFVLLR